MSNLDVAAELQNACAVLMVRPAAFASNPETAASNRFQSHESHSATASVQALLEFDRAVNRLRTEGIEAIVFNDSPQPQKPDAIFPNNWVSLHADGSVVLYPMMAENRRLERQPDMIAALTNQYDFVIERTIDLTYRERQGQYLEGTGSMVLDRRNRIAYACLSARTDIEVLAEFGDRLGYRIVTFEAFAFDAPIYHTNVAMAVGEHFAILCADALAPRHRDEVVRALESTGHRVIEITIAQMASFAGNLLELEGSRGKVIALSATAARSLSPEQNSQLERFGGKILEIEIPTIEMLGGGSVRCMLAEIHLPRKPR